MTDLRKVIQKTDKIINYDAPDRTATSSAISGSGNTDLISQKNRDIDDMFQALCLSTFNAHPNQINPSFSAHPRFESISRIRFLWLLK